MFFSSGKERLLQEFVLFRSIFFLRTSPADLRNPVAKLVQTGDTFQEALKRIFTSQVQVFKCTCCEAIVIGFLLRQS